MTNLTLYFFLLAAIYSAPSLNPSYRVTVSVLCTIAGVIFGLLPILKG